MWLRIARRFDNSDVAVVVVVVVVVGVVVGDVVGQISRCQVFAAVDGVGASARDRPCYTREGARSFVLHT